MSETKFREIDLNRIELNPGEVLIATIVSDELDQESMTSIHEMLRTVFPNNKVIVMGTGSEGKVNFTVAKDATISDTVKEESETACSDCTCGKK